MQPASGSLTIGSQTRGSQTKGSQTRGSQTSGSYTSGSKTSGSMPIVSRTNGSACIWFANNRLIASQTFGSKTIQPPISRQLDD